MKLLDDKCPHSKIRIYTEKVDGKLVPHRMRCLNCGDLVRREVRFVTPEMAHTLPPQAQVITGTVTPTKN